MHRRIHRFIPIALAIAGLSAVMLAAPSRTVTSRIAGVASAAPASIAARPVPTPPPPTPPYPEPRPSTPPPPVPPMATLASRTAAASPAHTSPSAAVHAVVSHVSLATQVQDAMHATSAAPAHTAQFPAGITPPPHASSVTSDRSLPPHAPVRRHGVPLAPLVALALLAAALAIWIATRLGPQRLVRIVVSISLLAASTFAALAAFGSAAPAAASGWTWNQGTISTPSVSYAWSAVSCASTSDCVAVGNSLNSSGVAIYTTNGGATWSPPTFVSAT
ncbi:MAG: hypothetical protein ACYCS4_07730, partial [Acidimicrobiales bacterium]